MQVLICGDRNWARVDVIRAYVETLLRDTIIIEGNARGADKIAGAVAKELGMRVRVFPAEWDRYGKGAGPIRNKQMLDEKPDLVVAFHDDIEHSIGTKNCITQAKKMGIPFEVRTSMEYDESQYLADERVGLKEG